jgi:hypoxanthine phosphoribosyltransferase
MNEPEIQLLYDAETIQHKVSALGRRIERELTPGDPLILSNLGGSVIFLADLVRAIRRPVRFDFLQVQYRYSDGQDDLLDIQFPMSVEVAGQSVLVVKDVLATGVVDNFLRNQLLQRGAREVRFAALLDVPERRRTLFEADYALFLPKKTGLFVGYGLKYRGRYGNLDYLGLLEEA